jgi:hypothetical protein
MSDHGRNLAMTREIIVSACHMLLDTRRLARADRSDGSASADCYVLLHDATKLFCQYVSEMYGEKPTRRWSPVLPELLLSHPEKCSQTLAMIEQKDFRPLSYFQFVAA